MSLSTKKCLKKNLKLSYLVIDGDYASFHMFVEWIESQIPLFSLLIKRLIFANTILSLVLPINLTFGLQ